MKDGAMNWKVKLFLYMLSILLLREWFLPVMELTDFGHSTLFYLYVILFFILAFFDAVWWAGAVIQIAYILWAVHYLYFGQLFFSFETIAAIAADAMQSITFLIHSDIAGISDLSRTLLLFALIWMVAYLIGHWIEVKNSLIVFVSFTVLFVSLIDTFSPYDATASIIRIMFFGLLAVGCTALAKLANEHNLPIRAGQFVYLLLPLLAAVVSFGALAVNAPVHPPAWPDPVAFLFSGESGEQAGGKASKSGYDPDDSQLGGAFIQDHKPVFEATVDSRQYWRIETKDTYTSKGWLQTEQTDPEILRTNESLGQTESDEPSNAKLKFSQPLPFLVTPYGAQKILYPEALPIMHEIEANRMFLLMGMQEQTVEYETEFAAPKYTLSELKKAEMLLYETAAEDINPYLQLPDELPDRVRQLALSITEEQTAVYDKIKAVEQYFKENGFVYETQNVAVPAEDQDYVDQFLFDTKRGYCDNFSTSMVVMLRSAGIPARWAKGFAPGELTYKASGEAVYKVTNDEAHSWVEAYIPDIGWMPFEPTIGFSYPADIKNDIPKEQEEPENDETPEQPEPEQEKDKAADKQEKAKSELFEKLKKQLHWFFTQWWLYGAVAVLAAVSAIYAYSTRKKWMPRWKVKMLRKQEDGWTKFELQYKELLLQLGRAGMPKAQGMTLSQYATEVDSEYGGERMRYLTVAYEKGVYGKDLVSHDWNKLNEVWEDLIISTTC